MMNESTVRLVKGSQQNQNRHYLLASEVALLCRECNKVRRVADYFASGEAKLECSHRRPISFRKPEDVTSYEAAVTEAKRKNEGVPVSEAA
jgi:hypothetical protein